MKRVLGMGLVLAVFFAASPADAHIKRFRTGIVVSADAGDDSAHASLDTDKLDCLNDRTIDIYRNGVFQTSGSPSAGALVRTFPMDVGDEIKFVLKRLVLKKTARHTHLCTGKTEKVLATP